MISNIRYCSTLNDTRFLIAGSGPDSDLTTALKSVTSHLRCSNLLRGKFLLVTTIVVDTSFVVFIVTIVIIYFSFIINVRMSRIVALAYQLV